MKFHSLALAGLLFLGFAHTGYGQFIISSGTGTFAPSFRGLSNTIWFGWGSGSFDGATNDELIDNPAATIGTTSSGYSLNQVGTNDILSSGNNIYTASFTNSTLQLAIPASGTIGTGFTTIIVQGNTAFGGFNPDGLPSFGDILGISPTVVFGTNVTTSEQFWVKYEIPGNAASYNLDITLPAGMTSIAKLEVDTAWSASGYSTDTAQAVPEPNVAGLLLIGGVGSMLRRRRAKVI